MIHTDGTNRQVDLFDNILKENLKRAKDNKDIGVRVAIIPNEKPIKIKKHQMDDKKGKPAVSVKSPKREE